jgi:hypothetical protein
VAVAPVRRGQTPKSAAALANLKQVCETHLAGRYTIEVIDLLVNPKLAGRATRSWPVARRLVPQVSRRDPHDHRRPVERRPRPRGPSRICNRVSGDR